MAGLLFISATVCGEITVQHHDRTGINHHRNRREPVPGTGTCNTVTVIEAKQGSMCCALDVILVETQELVRQPVKGTARMRTAIQITENLSPLPHNKYVVHLFIHAYCQPPAAGIMQLIKMADNCAAGRCHRHVGQLTVAADRRLE